MSLEKDEASLLPWHQINAQTQLKTGQDIAKFRLSSSSAIFHFFGDTCGFDGGPSGVSFARPS